MEGRREGGRRKREKGVEGLGNEKAREAGKWGERWVEGFFF